MAERYASTPGRLFRVALLAVLAAASVSCAYYNTFYLARKYYMKATDGQPYEVDRESSAQRTNYNKSADYSKKLLGVHPNSKWVDDAWLMWARTFIGTDDPLKAVAMLEEFQTRFPKSELKPDAEFFLGLAYRAARRHETAVDRFNNFLAQAPRHELVPYAYYERSKALLSLRRYQEAGESAGQILERYPKHRLADRALRQRAEARYQQRDWKGARSDFRAMGELAMNDDDRLRYLLREVDCLESARELNEARELLQDARSHVTAPPQLPAVLRAGPSAAGTAAQQQAQRTVTLGPGQDRYGKLTLRMGGVELLDGKVTEAVRLFESVILDYPRTALAAEAQFRIGFAFETGAEDFARARIEYQKVKEQGGTSQFTQQAQQRTDNLDRLERFRTASGSDSLARQAEAKFLIAEHFLFNLDRPERALQEYADIADSSSDSSVVARALTAQAWVLARKLDRPQAADSLLWKVVREYPGTESQLAARDYLEAEGQTVDESLIVAPEFTAAPLFEAELTQAPGQVMRPGQVRPADPNAARFGAAGAAAGAARPDAVSDSIRLTMELRDSLVARSLRDTTAAGRAKADSMRRVLSNPDTTGRAAILAEFERSKSKPAATTTTAATTAPPATSRTLRDEPGARPVAAGGVAAGTAAGTAGTAAGAAGTAAGAAPSAAGAAVPSATGAASGAPAATRSGAGAPAATGAAAGTAGATGAAAGTAATTGAAARSLASPADSAAKQAGASAADTLTAKSVSAAPDTARRDSTSARADSGATARAQVPAGTGAGAAAVAPAGAVASKPAPTFKAGSTPPPAPPAKPSATSMSLTSFAKRPKLTPAQKDSVRREEAYKDSLKKARADSVKTAKAQAKAKSKAKAAPDTTAGNR